MNVTLKSEVSGRFEEGQAIALVLVEAEDGQEYVLSAIEAEATDLANHALLNHTVDVQEGVPPAPLADWVHRCVCEYRWDWGLTPVTRILFATSLKVLQAQIS